MSPCPLLPRQPPCPPRAPAAAEEAAAPPPPPPFSGGRCESSPGPGSNTQGWMYLGSKHLVESPRGAGTLPVHVTIGQRGHPDGRTAPGQPIRAGAVTQHSRERAVSSGIWRSRGWAGLGARLVTWAVTEGAAPAPSRGTRPQPSASPAPTAHPRAAAQIRQVPGPPTGSSRGNFLPAGTSRSRALWL